MSVYQKLFKHAMGRLLLWHYAELLLPFTMMILLTLYLFIFTNFSKRPSIIHTNLLSINLTLPHQRHKRNYDLVSQLQCVYKYACLVINSLSILAMYQTLHYETPHRMSNGSDIIFRRIKNIPRRFCIPLCNTYLHITDNFHLSTYILCM